MWIHFLTYLFSKFQTKDRKINSVDTRCLASSPRQFSLLIIYPINQKNHNNHTAGINCQNRLIPAVYYVFKD